MPLSLFILFIHICIAISLLFRGCHIRGEAIMASNFESNQEEEERSHPANVKKVKNTEYYHNLKRMLTNGEHHSRFRSFKETNGPGGGVFISAGIYRLICYFLCCFLI